MINFMDNLLNFSLTNQKIQEVMEMPKTSLHNFIFPLSTIRQSTAFFAELLGISQSFSPFPLSFPQLLCKPEELPIV